MTKNRSTVFVSGCHLCPSLMARPPTDGKYLTPQLILWALDNDIEIVQMRCPETEYSGSDRQPKGRGYYDKAPCFHALCAEIAAFEASRIKEYGNVIAVIGVTTSPACGTNFGGKNPYQPSGIYMEELRRETEARGLNPKFVSIWPGHPHKMAQHLASLMDNPNVS